MQKDINRIIEFLKSETSDDCSYHSGKIFGSMTSFPEEDVKQVFFEFMENNAGDPNIFAGTSKIENKVIQLLGNMFHCHTPAGNIVSGGSEANVVGLWAARNFYHSKHKNSSGKLELIAPVTRHTSIDKAADLLDVKLRLIEVNKKDFTVDVNKVKESINDNTFAIVGIAGNTVYGAIDDIKALSEIAIDKNKWLHVDAAFGGFAIPFLSSPPKFDFELEGVKSFVVDPHKNLGSTIPNGAILFRDYNYSEKIIHHLPYFSGEKTENRTIVGTKTGGTILATYYILKFKGMDWLKKRMIKAFNNTQFLKRELLNRKFDIKGKVQLNVIAAMPTLPKYESKRTELFRKGWRIGKYGKLWRFVVMPTVIKENIVELLRELDS